MNSRTHLPAFKSLFTALIAGALLCFALALAPTAKAVTVVFSQPPSPAGGIHKSSWYAPDGLDGDEYAWDNFTIPAGAAITEIHWRGGYAYNNQGVGRAPVYSFTVAIYRSIGGGSQPDVGTGGRLVRYIIAGNAGESPAGTFGGVPMYDYAFTLPAPFQAAPGTIYWVQIEASQGLTPNFGWPPDWGPSAATGGNNSHFRRITGGPYQVIGGDLAFSLYASSAPNVAITASPSPAQGGSVAGAGAYPVNSTVTLDAAPNPGWGFVNWTVGAAQVSTSPHYTFTAAADRVLSANFVPAYTVVTSAFHSYAGVTTGDGAYNSGSTVTVTATPNHGFVFTGWSDGDPSPSHSFVITADTQLAAFFESAPSSVTFDFDNARVHAPLPIDLTVNGLTAVFSATGQGFSVQAAGELGILPPGFSGLDLLPSSVFASDLIVEFSDTLSDFSILYAPQELACDTSATMRATAYLNGAFAGTATATAPFPGTYPAGTLSIAVPAGFNRVVVHYDARPPTCQDWGPIFLADNVTVTRTCVQPTVTSEPVGAAACSSRVASFAVGASGSALSYQWRLEAPPASGQFVDIVDGPVAGLGVASGANSAVLELSGLNAPVHGAVRCQLSNACGTATSQIAALSACPVDFNCDGLLDPDDIADYIACFFASPPCAMADWNGDGFTDPDDLSDYIAGYFGGC